MPKVEELEITYTSNHPQGVMALAQAFVEIEFWKRMEILMPMVAAELVKAGVIFPAALAPPVGEEEAPCFNCGDIPCRCPQ